MKILNTVLLCLLLTGVLQAQSKKIIRVVDQTTLQPVENVLIHDKEKKTSIQTDFKGRADVSVFSNEAELTFRHPAFETFTLPVSELESFGNMIPLAEKVIRHDEVVVSASRWEQDRNEIPNEIIRIEPEEIKFKNPQTSADLLAQTGQVFVQKSQMGGGSPMLRGFAANSVLLVVDGIRMNNAIFRGGNLQNVIMLDPSIIEEAEVVFGPGSVIYGSDALGGVMDFHTLKPRYSSENSTFIKGQAMAGYSSANNEQTFHADLNFGLKKWAFLTSFTHSRFDDLRAGNNRPAAYPDYGKRFFYTDRAEGEDLIRENDNVNRLIGSGYSQWNFMQKAGFRPNERLDLAYSFYLTSSSDIPRYDRLIQVDSEGNPRSAEWYYGPQRWMLNSFRMNWFAENKFFDMAKITLAHQRTDEDRFDRRFNDDRLRVRREDVDMLTVNADFDKEFSEQTQLFYGIEAVHNDVRSSGERQNLITGEVTPVSPRYPGGGSILSTAALYSVVKHNFNEKLTVNAGLRYSRVYLFADFSDKEFYDFPFNAAEINTGALNGSLGLVFRPDSRTQFNLNISNGFRTPNVDDVGKIFDSEPGNVVVPNPNLKAENSYSAEFGVIKSIGERLKISGTMYYTLLRDAIVRRDFTFGGRDSILYDGEMSKVQALANAGTAYIWGYSLGLDAMLMKGLSFSGSMTYTEGEDTTEGIPLRHVPPLFGQLSLKYRMKKLKAEFFTVFNDWKTYRSLSPSEQNKTHLYTENGTPAWYTLNARLSYQLNRHIQLNCALENIADVHYRPFSSGISAPGRNFIIRLRSSF